MSTDITDATDAVAGGETSGPPDTGGEGHADAHGEHHGLTDMQYVGVAAILAVITGLEVSISYLDIGPLFLPVLLTLMVIKFFAVVLYFMHLKFDNRIFKMLFYLGLGLAAFVYTGALLTFHFYSGG